MKKTDKNYGFELVMDLYDCSLDVLTSKKKLQQYVDQLCDLIAMKKFGKTFIPYFGENAEYTKGYSLVQLIETSSITGHFSELWRTAYINVFSCKPYDHQVAKSFTRDYFRAGRIRARMLQR